MTRCLRYRIRHGVVGEGVYPAALRELRETAGVDGAEVWAVDLSGEWAVFGCEVPSSTKVVTRDLRHDRFEWLPAPQADTPLAIGLRTMSRADLPDVVRWQRAVHVARWWAHESPDVAAAERNYGPAIDGDDPTRMWVIELNGRSVGFIQDYRIGDHPEYALLTAEPDAIGFDYAIGDPTWVGRGIGTRILWTYLRDVVRPHHPDAPTYFAAPDHHNAASLRVLDKLGFRRGLWFDEPQPDGRVDTVVSCTLDARRIFG